MARDFAAELAAARTAGDWAAHERIWEERRVGSVEADEAALEAEYTPGEKVMYRGEVVEIDSRYEISGDYLILCGDGYYRQANPQELSRRPERPPVDWTGIREIHARRDAARRQRIAVLRGAIGHARCVLSEDWQSVESVGIARANLAKYCTELKDLEKVA